MRDIPAAATNGSPQRNQTRRRESKVRKGPFLWKFMAHGEFESEHPGAFRKKVYRSTDELQADLDTWIKEYNEARPHRGRWCFGKTPMQTFLDTTPMTKEKMIAGWRQRTPEPDRSTPRAEEVLLLDAIASH
jgi:Integrase core domain